MRRGRSTAARLGPDARRLARRRTPAASAAVFQSTRGPPAVQLPRIVARCGRGGLTAPGGEDKPLAVAARCLSLKTLRWLAAVRIEPTDARSRDRLVGQLGACWHFHEPRPLRWIIVRYALAADDARVNSNALLRMLCRRDQHLAARWLDRLCGLTPADGRAWRNEALLDACYKNQLAVARWLTLRYELTARDMLADRGITLRLVCARGHLALVQWLVAHLRLTADEMRVATDMARRHGRLELAHWLETYYDMAPMSA